MILLKNLISGLFLISLSASLYAGQGDYDGKWSGLIRCSADGGAGGAYSGMPASAAYTRENVYSIENGVISAKYTTQEGRNTLTTEGVIGGSVAKLNIDGTGGGARWVLNFTGKPLSENKIVFTGEQFFRGSKTRDCSMEFTSTEPSVGSLAYLKKQQQSVAKVEPVKPVTSAPPLAKVESPKVVETKPAAPTSSLSSTTNKISEIASTKSPEPPKPTSDSKRKESEDSEMLTYLLIGGGVVLIAGILFAISRRRKSALNQKDVEIKQPNISSVMEGKLAQKAKELELEKLRLQEVERQLKEKEILAARNTQALKDAAQAEADALKKRSEEHLRELRKKAEDELATAKAIKDAAVLKRQAEEELARAEAMKMAAQAESRLAAERQKTEEILARAQALKNAEERKRKAEEEYERLKSADDSPVVEIREEAIINCVSCGTELKAGAKFCNRCGTKRI